MLRLSWVVFFFVQNQKVDNLNLQKSNHQRSALAKMDPFLLINVSAITRKISSQIITVTQSILFGGRTLNHFPKK